MKVLEDWYLDKFIPWFMYVAPYIGIFATCLGISYCLHMLFKWEIYYSFMTLLLGGSYLFYNMTGKRVQRRIAELVECEIENITLIIREGSLIDQDLLNRIVLKIVNRLREEGFVNSGENNSHREMYGAVRGAILRKCAIIHKIGGR